MVYLKTHVYNLDITIRDIEVSDINTLTNYWHNNDSDYLRTLGVDLTKLASEAETRQRFMSSIPDEGRSRDRATFVVLSGKDIMAYTNLHIKSVEEVYVHFHVLRLSPRHRAIAYRLFPAMIRIFFDSFAIAKLTMQTALANQRINYFLQEFGLCPKQSYISMPDGLARPGLFNVYEISREFLTRLETQRPLFCGAFSEFTI